MTLNSRSSLLSAFSKISFEPPTWYDNLPIPILVKIFNGFDERELLSQIVPVCKKWRKAALKPMLWKTFQVSGESVPVYFICHKIRNFTYLTTIRLNAVTQPVAIIKQISRSLPNLKKFTLKNSGVIPEMSLRTLIQCCKDLELLNLSGTRFKAYKFYEELAGLINLKSINFSQNVFLKVCNLLSLVLNCQKLEELKISSFNPIKPAKPLRDEDVKFIITNLAPELKSLSLDANDLTNFSFKAILQCSKLEKLSLYRARNLSPDVFVSMPKHFENLSSLKTRDAHLITGTNVSELFANGKTTMSNLMAIDFSGCWKITDIGLEAIGQCCPKLNSLRLKSCKSLQNLSPIRDNCTNLMVLSVAFCTKLDPHTVLPLPAQIKTLIIDKNNKLYPFIHDIFNNKNIVIKICLSEYNKEMKNMNLTV